MTTTATSLGGRCPTEPFRHNLEEGEQDEEGDQETGEQTQAHVLAQQRCFEMRIQGRLTSQPKGPSPPLHSPSPTHAPQPLPTHVPPPRCLLVPRRFSLMFGGRPHGLADLYTQVLSVPTRPSIASLLSALLATLATCATASRALLVQP
jgi:hypothetical protein